MLIVAKRLWLREEVKYLYFRLNELELLHLKLSKEFLIYDEWTFFNDKVELVVESKMSKKQRVQKHKLQRLISKELCECRINRPEIITDFVKNLFSETFNEDELNLLNFGLNFTLPPKSNKVKDFIIDVQYGLNTLEYFRNSPLNDGEKEKQFKEQETI